MPWEKAPCAGSHVWDQQAKFTAPRGTVDVCRVLSASSLGERFSALCGN